MDEILRIFQENKTIFLVFAVICVGSLVVNMMMLNRRKKRGAGLLEQHPDAAKVYLTSKALITSEAVTVSQVNGNEPFFFHEGGKTGFYAPAGIAEVEMTYTYSRPGITAKNVITTYGPLTKKLELAPHGSYFIGFDRKEETFTFDKYEG